MRIEDKLIRGKSVLSPEGDEEEKQYNVWHILAGTVLLMLIPLVFFFASGRNVAVLYVSQYLAGAIVGISIGYLSGCVPWVSILVIVLATTGKMLFNLLLGKSGSFGSMEFNVRMLAWAAFVSVIFASAYLGARMKGRRLKQG